MLSHGLYMVCVAAMTAVAALPICADRGHAWLVLLAVGWISGVLVVRPHTSLSLSDYPLTVLAIVSVLAIPALLLPEIACIMLFAILLVARNPDAFGLIVGLSLLTLVLGLDRTTSCAYPALYLAALVCASYFRAARSPNLQTFATALLILAASLCAGGLALLLSPSRALLLSAAAAQPASRTKPSAVPFIVLLAALPIVAIILVKNLNLFSRRSRGHAAVKGEAGRLIDEGRLAEARARAFAGRPRNVALTAAYVKWRQRLSGMGIAFRRDRTCEESEPLLATRLRGAPEQAIARVTALFNAARYGPEEVSAGELEEFTRLVKGLSGVPRGAAR